MNLRPPAPHPRLEAPTRNLDSGSRGAMTRVFSSLGGVSNAQLSRESQLKGGQIGGFRGQKGSGLSQASPPDRRPSATEGDPDAAPCDGVPESHARTASAIGRDRRAPTLHRDPGSGSRVKEALPPYSKAAYGSATRRHVLQLAQTPDMIWRPRALTVSHPSSNASQMPGSTSRHASGWRS
jgi:hypothetical protein